MKRQGVRPRTFELILPGDDFERILCLVDNNTRKTYKTGVFALSD